MARPLTPKPPLRLTVDVLALKRPLTPKPPLRLTVDVLALKRLAHSSSRAVRSAAVRDAHADSRCGHIPHLAVIGTSSSKRRFRHLATVSEQW